MNGKGSRRRRMQIQYDDYAKRWDDVFGPKDDKPTAAMCQACGKSPEECKCITLKELAARMGITM